MLPRTALLLAALASGPTPVLAAFQNDFSFYPSAAQSCLYAAAASSGCNGDTADAMNKCLCGNGGSFATNTASCLGSSDPGDVSSVYSTMSTACSTSKTPLAVSQSEFMAAASGAASVSVRPTTAVTTHSGGGVSTVTRITTSDPKTTVSVVTSVVTSDGETVTVTSSSTPTNTGGNSDNGDNGKDNNNNSSGGGGLSRGAKIGIYVGAAVVGLAIIAAVIFCLVRRRRRRAVTEESHPMLPQKFGYPSSSLGGGGGRSSGAGSHYYHADQPTSGMDVGAGAGAGAGLGGRPATLHDDAHGDLGVPELSGASPIFLPGHLQHQQQQQPQKDWKTEALKQDWAQHPHQTWDGRQTQYWQQPQNPQQNQQQQAAAWGTPPPGQPAAAWNVTPPPAWHATPQPPTSAQGWHGPVAQQAGWAQNAQTPTPPPPPPPPHSHYAAGQFQQQQQQQHAGGYTGTYELAGPEQQPTQAVEIGGSPFHRREDRYYSAGQGWGNGS